MTEKATAYPLAWPQHMPRERYPAESRFRKKKPGKYGGNYGQVLTLHESLVRLEDSLRRCWDLHLIEDCVVSTNLRLKLNGLPKSGQRTPDDSGVAVYLVTPHDGHSLCFPCDRWNRIPCNIAAIAGHIDCIAAMDRWGVGESKDRYAGYTALPSPDQVQGESWVDVLNVSHDTSLSIAREAYYSLAAKTHPDHGGSNDAFHRVSQAWKQAKEALGAT